jgi:meso-butanediol dehydrogenase/(S,S)-butanediol dehydrogenase/diacetyl reductase
MPMSRSLSDGGTTMDDQTAVFPLRFSPGRRALVTGGASGFGLGIVNRLVGVGARVVAADISERALGALAGAHPEGAVLPLRMDVADDASVAAGIAWSVEQLGGLDTLVNSAGVFQFRPLEEITTTEWDWILDVNLKGAFLVTRESMPHLKDSGRGRVVNISSDAGKRGWALLAAYSASKFGLIGLTEAVAAEVGPSGVRVNCVCPATVAETGMGQDVVRQKIDLGWGASAGDVLRRGAESFPLRRVGTIADVADAIMFLLSENSSWITGIALNVDGGELSG